MTPDTNMIDPIHPKKPFDNATIDAHACSQTTGTENISRTQNVSVSIMGDNSCSMRFLDAQLKRSKSLDMMFLLRHRASEI